jgi:hypothetical protein
MSSPSTLAPAEALYEEDFITWTELMAERLAKRDAAGLDWDHLAEEIRDLGISYKHALASHLENVQLHLIKWELQPKRRSRSWEDSISNSRREIDLLLERFPSLRRYPKQIFDHSYDGALKRALREMRLAEAPSYKRRSLAEVLDPGFLPD